MSCLITGCVLVDEQMGRAVIGDLFKYPGVWLFNANVWPNKEANWQSSDGVPSTARQLIASGRNPEVFWERRGVIVIPEGEASLNEAAKEYLRG